MVETCAAAGVPAESRDGHPGCWCDAAGHLPRKIGALGIRVERGVSYHGIALNIAPDLADFELIDACGMPGVRSTSIALEAGPPDRSPSTDDVAWAAGVFARAFAATLGVELAGDLPPVRPSPWEPAGVAGR
jgi:lipoyl(octanoyl) transferase